MNCFTFQKRLEEQHGKILAVLTKLGGVIDDELPISEFRSVMTFLNMYVRVHFAYEACGRQRFPQTSEATANEADRRLTEALEQLEEQYQREGVSRELVRRFYIVTANWIDAHASQPETPDAAEEQFAAVELCA